MEVNINDCPERLKHFLFEINEILEGRGEEFIELVKNVIQNRTSNRSEEDFSVNKNERFFEEIEKRVSTSRQNFRFRKIPKKIKVFDNYLKMMEMVRVRKILGVSISHNLLKKVKEECQGKNVSAFVERAITKELAEKEKERQEFRTKLIKDYQKVVQSQKRGQEDKIWDKTSSDGLNNE
ncbi:hypothetical protein C1645_743814 [Glomus cerebriforme]|uniref:Uncharacterized protein n=1 Tax=Glomus cerebriforme TaxID=658196 RepID=A0A397S7Q9_9GLOM|nr:hypothetical protein C1645_743814 [Glomus cerebriforme]